MSKKGRKFPRGLTVKLACDGVLSKPNFEEEDGAMNQELQCFHVNAFIGDATVDLAEFKERITKKKFYVINFNILCYVEHSNIFIPIEVGLVEYSIANGVSRSYHKVIDYGSIPPGYFGAAKMQSEDTHDLLLAKVVKENQYSNIWNEIMLFLDTGQETLPPVFTHHHQVEQTVGCLRWFLNKVDNPVDLQVLDLSILHYKLCLALQHYISFSETITLLDEPKFDFSFGTRCKYHEESDSQYCALGLSKRLCYLMSDSICKLFDISLTEQHKPPILSISEGSHYHQLSSNSASSHNKTYITKQQRKGSLSKVTSKKTVKMDGINIEKNKCNLPKQKSRTFYSSKKSNRVANSPKTSLQDEKQLNTAFGDMYLQYEKTS